MNVAEFFLNPLEGGRAIGSSTRIKELAFSLSKLGVSTCIFTPYEKDMSVNAKVKVKSVSRILSVLGISKIVYGGSRRAYYNSFFVKKLMSRKWVQEKLAQTMAKRVIKYFEKQDFDLVQAEQDIALSTCMKIAEKIDVPLAVDLHNITAEELVATGIIRKEGKEYRNLQTLLKSLLQQVDLVIVVSDLMREYVHSVYDVDPRRVVTVPPGGRVRVNQTQARNLKVVYSGLVTCREHVDLFVKSIPLIKKKRPRNQFYVTNKGEELKRIKRIAASSGVRVNYYWYPREADFYNFLSSCKIGVLPSSNDLARKIGTPIKLFSYLSAGLPVVANDIGGWSDFLRDEGVGILVEDDPTSFASAILQIENDESLWSQLSKAGLKLVSTKCNWNTIAKELLHAYKGIVR